MGSPEAAVRAQAEQLAAAWSGPEAPCSWALTAALFTTLRDDPQLLGLAARIDAHRLPALLFVAAVMALVQRERPHPLSAAVPAAGDDVQPPVQLEVEAGGDLVGDGHLTPGVAGAAAQQHPPVRVADGLPVDRIHEVRSAHRARLEMLLGVELVALRSESVEHLGRVFGRWTVI